MADTVDITGLQIIKVGTLYFIPVNQSMRSVELPGAWDDGPNYGQAVIVTTSGHDQFHDANGKRHWVVVNIPALRNGDTRGSGDITRELEVIVRYLFSRDLMPSPDYPGVVIGDPFDLAVQPA